MGLSKWPQSKAGEKGQDWAGARVHHRERGPQVQPEEGGEMSLGVGSEWVQHPLPQPVPAHHEPPHWAEEGGQGGAGPQ